MAQENELQGRESLSDWLGEYLSASTGINVTHDDSAESITFKVTLEGLTTADLAESGNLYFTAVRAQDAINTDENHATSASHDFGTF